MKVMKRKWNKKVCVGMLFLFLLVFAVGGKIFLKKRAMAAAKESGTVQSVKVEKGSISTTVTGTGTLQEGTAESVRIPTGIKIKKYW